MSGTPQIENGFTKIANELMDALARTRLSGESRQVLDAIIRKTYGWGKRSDDISLSQFKILTGLSKPTICRAIKKLIEMNMIIKKGCASTLFTKQGTATTSTYSIQKDYKFWRVLPKKVTVIDVDKKVNLTLTKMSTIDKNVNVDKKVNDVDKNVNLTLTKMSTIDKNVNVDKKVNDVDKNVNLTLTKMSIYTKERIKENKFSRNSTEFRLAQLLLNLILKRDPDHKKPDLQQWASHVDAIMRLDNRKADDIETVIRWCQSGATKESRFWNNNILSTGKLRDKFDQLKLKMEVDEIKQNPPEINRSPNGYKPAQTPIRTAEGTRHIGQILKDAGDRAFRRRRAKA
jgi:phage replication O-like protein O